MLEKTSSMVSQIPVVGSEGIPYLERDPAQLEGASSILRKDVMEEDMEGGNNLFRQDKIIEEAGGVGRERDAVIKKKNFLINRANRLLGQYNFDSDRLERDLHQIVPRGGQQVHDEEVYDHRVQVISTTIHEALMTTVSGCEHQALCQLEDSWAREKRELLEELRKSDANKYQDKAVMGAMVERPVNDLPFGDHSTSTSYAISGPDASRVNAYYKILEDSPNLSGADLASKFLAIANKFNDSLPPCAQTWKLLEFILKDEHESWFLGVQKFLEEQYRQNVVLRNHESSQPVKQSVVNWLRQVKTQDPLSGFGGLAAELERYSSSGYNSIQGGGFGRHSMGLNAAAGGIDAGDMFAAEPVYYGGSGQDDPLPLWAVAFYCMRSGAWQDAVEVLAKDQSNDEVAKLMCKILKSMVPRPGEVDMHDLARLERLVNAGPDRGTKEISTKIQQFSPWKKAILYMILKGSTTRAGQLLDRCVNASVQDYMWMKLNIILSFGPNQRVEQNEGIKNLQEVICRNGPEHFNDGQDPQLYGRLLLMSQLPAEAIKYLADRPCVDFSTTSITDAVHMSLCLRDELANDEDIVNIVQRYTKRFVTKQPNEAMLYFKLLTKAGGGRSQRLAIINGVVKFLLDHTDEPEVMLKLLNGFEDRELVQEVLLNAGRAAQSKGRLIEAVRLLRYDPAGIEDALRIFNAQMVQAIRPPHSARELWKQEIVAFERRYAPDIPKRGGDKLETTFRQLGRLLFFTQDFDNGDWEAALDKVSIILPRNHMGLDSAIQGFYLLDQSVLEVFPYIFELALKALHKLYQSRQGDKAATSRLEELFRAYEAFFASIPETSPHLAQLLARGL